MTNRRLPRVVQSALSGRHAALVSFTLRVHTRVHLGSTQGQNMLSPVVVLFMIILLSARPLSWTSLHLRPALSSG